MAVTKRFAKRTPLRVTAGAEDAAVPPGEMDLGALLQFLRADCRDVGDDWGGDGVRERVREDVDDPVRNRDGEPQHNGPRLVVDGGSSGGGVRHEFSSLN